MVLGEFISFSLQQFSIYQIDNSFNTLYTYMWAMNHMLYLYVTNSVNKFLFLLRQFEYAIISNAALCYLKVHMLHGILIQYREICTSVRAFHIETHFFRHIFLRFCCKSILVVLYFIRCTLRKRMEKSRK